jgi:hypothetical protein
MKKVLRQDHAIDGSYLCDFCGESHYQKPSQLYLYKFTLDDFSWLKLGFARNLTLRKASYGLDKNVVTELLLNINFDNGREVMLFEKKLHKMFKEYQLDKKLMKSFHKHNGYSECYVETALHFIVDNIRKEHERIK